MTAATVAARSVTRIEDRVHVGPDEQVDDRAVVIAPGRRPSQTDPFLLLSEDWFSSPGFEWHPHRGVETVTLVLDGVLEHGDSTGNSGALDTGDVQWMTAGRGIIHRELAYRDERAHTLQLWVNLPAAQKLTEPRYQDLLAADRPVLHCDGAPIDLISGTAAQLQGPVHTQWPISGAIVTVEPGRRIDYVIPPADRAFAYLLSGRARIGGHRLAAGQIAWSDPVAAPQTTWSLAAAPGDEPAVIMVYSGEPIRETVAFGGPFVMNNPAEIEAAYRDLRAGGFGQVPRHARLDRR